MPALLRLILLLLLLLLVLSAPALVRAGQAQGSGAPMGVAGLRQSPDGPRFAAYLERWSANSPARLRATIGRVPALFGIIGPAVPRAQLAAR